MLELGISTLCDKQRLHRESWIICGEDRYSVKKGIECWMRDVEEGHRGRWDLGWIMIMAGSTENVIDG